MGEVRAKVVLGGLELGTHLLNYAPAPTADALKDLLDIHVQLIAESLECFAKSGHSLEDLDQRLANIVQESHGAAEQLFTPIQYTTHSGKSIARSLRSLRDYAIILGSHAI